MARPTIEDVIREIQELQLSLMDAMDESLKPIFANLANQVIEISDGLKLNPNAKAETLNEILGLKKQISDVVINNPAYASAVASVIAGFKDLAKLADKYFGLVIDNYTRNDVLYKAIMKANVELTKDALLGAGIRSNFGNAIGQVLKANISGRTDRATLNKTLRKFIEGTADDKAYLERYVKQTTNDSVMVFNREYMQAISDDLELQHYYYAGTIMKDSRSFCAARAGRYFTKQEVEQWPDFNWKGKMAGTNKATIFSYAGGYNCRHLIYPVSIEQYEDRVKRQGINPSPKIPK
jgi:hypothetical protein